MPGSTTPDGFPYALPGDAVADYPATSQDLATRVQALANRVPATNEGPTSSNSQATNNVTATAWAALAGSAVVMTLDPLPVGTRLLVTWHAWLVVVGGTAGDVRCDLEASGGVVKAAGSPTGHHLYLASAPGGSVSLSRSLLLTVTNATPITLQLKAQQAGGGTRQVNFPGIVAVPFPGPFASTP